MKALAAAQGLPPNSAGSMLNLRGPAIDMALLVLHHLPAGDASGASLFLCAYLGLKDQSEFMLLGQRRLFDFLRLARHLRLRELPCIGHRKPLTESPSRHAPAARPANPVRRTVLFPPAASPGDLPRPSRSWIPGPSRSRRESRGTKIISSRYARAMCMASGTGQRRRRSFRRCRYWLLRLESPPYDPAPPRRWFAHRSGPRTCYGRRTCCCRKGRQHEAWADPLESQFLAGAGAKPGHEAFVLNPGRASICRASQLGVAGLGLRESQEQVLAQRVRFGGCMKERHKAPRLLSPSCVRLSL